MPTPCKPPAAVSRRLALAAQWSQRAGLFKARNYMGPVRVELARCTYRWFWLTLSTQPWQKEARSRLLEWQVRPQSVSLSLVGIEVCAYDTVGILVIKPELMARIEALRQSGASVEQLLRVFNGW